MPFSYLQMFRSLSRRELASALLFLKCVKKLNVGVSFPRIYSQIFKIFQVCEWVNVGMYERERNYENMSVFIV